MRQYYGQPAAEYLPLPTQFAVRVRAGSVVTGVALLVGTLLVLGLTAFVNRPLHGQGLPRAGLGTLGLALPALSVTATAIVVLTARRCLHGNYLVTARARTTRTALTICFAALSISCLLALTISALIDIWGEGGRLGLTDLLATFANFTLGTIGHGAGLWYVRPSVRTLEKFSDHPIW
ncbi:hypothetical protein [Amycolatopsis panacis]|uniref:DUF5671 domain-containing protein n=1 Tax=Amycolatopsis panacis TaxID=2340917 RepID=A0A419I5A8_9PSEU|nr:hypothetical protein [Amycolatopsis panacis]RJQ85954.1 hypothetical protein D5S19_12230 [Amycolatopsis panacis]